MKRISIVMIFAISLGLSAQEVLIPYRQGEMWGLADTSGKIKMRPKYDSLFNLNFREEVFFMFLKNGQQGVGTKSKEILPAEHKLLQFAEGAFIRSQIEYPGNQSFWKYYTLNGYLLCNDTVRRVNYMYGLRLDMPFHYKLMLVRLKNKKECLFLIDMKTNTVLQKLVSNAVDINHYSSAHNRRLIEVEEKQNEIVEYELRFDKATNQIIKEKTPKTFDSEIAEAEMIEVPAGDGYYDEVAIDGGYYEEEERKKKNGKPLEVFQFDASGKTLVLNTYIGRIDAMGFQKNIKLAESNVYSKIKSKDVQLRKFVTNVYREKHNVYKDLSGDYSSNNNYALYQKKKKLGIVTQYGIIAPQFVNVKGIGASKEKGAIPSFIVGVETEKGLKYGVIKADGNWTLAAEFDTLETVNIKSYWYGVSKGANLAYVKAKKAGKYYLLNASYEQLLPEGYDCIDISKKYDYKIGLQNNNKFGYFNGQSGRRALFIEPMFDYEVSGLRSFNRYKVALLQDSNGVFVGYADLKGFNYFEE